MHAAGVGNDAKVKRLLKAKVDVNLESDGALPLHLACVYGPRLHYAACWAGDDDRDACEAAARRDAEAFKGGMTVKEINAAFGERAGERRRRRSGSASSTWG